MEQDKKNLLEMIDRPAFFVRHDKIIFANQMAKNRQVKEGSDITDLLVDHADAYHAFTDGCLYLTLELGLFPCGATVTRQDDGALFLLDRDWDITQLQALALAGQQLRMPLSNVMTLADRLLPRLEDDPSTKEQAGQLSRGLFQLLRIISNMADGERYAGADAPNLEITEISGFLREVVAKAQAALETTTINICYHGLERHVFSLVDRERLERSVYNLISNAVKFSPPEGTVTIAVVNTGKHIRISVEDQGCGIANHVIGSLFNRYQREPSIEDSRFGLGLGMTLVRTTAAIHGGTVLVDQPGGTRVTLSLAIRKTVPGGLRSPVLRIGDYLGGWDAALTELSETLPISAYENNL